MSNMYTAHVQAQSGGPVIKAPHRITKQWLLLNQKKKKTNQKTVVMGLNQT